MSLKPHQVRNCRQSADSWIKHYHVTTREDFKKHALTRLKAVITIWWPKAFGEAVRVTYTDFEAVFGRDVTVFLLAHDLLRREGASGYYLSRKWKWST